MSGRERGSRLYGAMVISLAEGNRLGRVSEVYMNRQTKQMLGIAYKSGMWGTDTENYVGFEDIHKFSHDVILVSSQSAANELSKEIAQSSLRALRGCKIGTQAGRYIGELTDVVINREDGKIVELLLPENKSLQIDIADVLMGPDIILVPAGYEFSTNPAEPEQEDFFRRIFGNAAFSETFREGFEGVKTSMRNSVNTEKVMHSLKNSSLKARDTVLRTSQAIQQTIDQIMKKKESEKTAPRGETSPIVTPMDVNTSEPVGQPDSGDELGPEPMPTGEFVRKPGGGEETPK